MAKPDKVVTTRQSKQIAFIRNDMINWIADESEYSVICAAPDVVWLLATLLEFYSIFNNRWSPDWGTLERDDLIARAAESLICPMACAEDIQAINSTLQAISLTLIEMRDLIAPPGADIHTDLTDIKTELEGIKNALPSSVPTSLIDDIEEAINGVGVILGAASVL